jgi:hypothetical protein
VKCTEILYDSRLSFYKDFFSRNPKPLTSSDLSESSAVPTGFRVDEKTAFQALDRLVPPCCRLSWDAPTDLAFEYYRHETHSARALLDTTSSRIHGKTIARHITRDFVVFLREVDLAVLAAPTDSHRPDILSAHQDRFGSRISSKPVPASSSISYPHTLPGSISLNAGSPQSNERLWPTPSSQSSAPSRLARKVQHRLLVSDST